jgi:hypothetical protein
MMDESVLAFLGFVGIFVVLDVAALHFGVDSRGLTRELPLPGEPVVRNSPDHGRHQCALLTLEAREDRPLLAWPAPPRSLTPIARCTSSGSATDPCLFRATGKSLTGG